MSDGSKKPKTELQPVADPKEALGLIKEGAKTFAAAMIWTKDQKHVINTHLHRFSEEEKILYVWIPKDFNGKKFRTDLTEMGEKHCYLSVALMRANLFFRSEFRGIDSGMFKFGLPEKLFKIQRRNDIRFVIPDGLVLKVSFQHPLFPETQMTKKVLDISAGGLAFLATDLEDGIFVKDLVLKGLTFTIRGKELSCDGEVRHVAPLPVGFRHQGVRVGVSFKKFGAADQKHLTSYVFEETRKFFSRIM